jgi:hypothetical protein
LIEPDKNIGSSIGFSNRQIDADDDFERILEDSDINMTIFSPV